MSFIDGPGEHTARQPPKECVVIIRRRRGRGAGVVGAAAARLPRDEGRVRGAAYRGTEGEGGKEGEEEGCEVHFLMLGRVEVGGGGTVEGAGFGGRDGMDRGIEKGAGATVEAKDCAARNDPVGSGFQRSGGQAQLCIPTRLYALASVDVSRTAVRVVPSAMPPYHHRTGVVDLFRVFYLTIIVPRAVQTH